MVSALPSSDKTDSRANQARTILQVAHPYSKAGSACCLFVALWILWHVPLLPQHVGRDHQVLRQKILQRLVECW